MGVDGLSIYCSRSALWGSNLCGVLVSLVGLPSACYCWSAGYWIVKKLLSKFCEYTLPLLIYSTGEWIHCYSELLHPRIGSGGVILLKKKTYLLSFRPQRGADLTGGASSADFERINLLRAVDWRWNPLRAQQQERQIAPNSALRVITGDSKWCWPKRPKSDIETATTLCFGRERVTTKRTKSNIALEEGQKLPEAASGKV